MSKRKFDRLVLLQGVTFMVLAGLATAMVHAHHAFQFAAEEKIGSAQFVPRAHVDLIIGEANDAVYIGVSSLALGLLFGGVSVLHLYWTRKRQRTTED